MRSLNIKDLLYVPEIDKNLISVKKLDKEGYKIYFEGGACNILKRDINVTTELSSGLYKVNAAERVCVILDNQYGINCQHIWHKKFGHRDIKGIQLLQ